MRRIARATALLVPLLVVLGSAGVAQAKPKAAPPVLTEKPAKTTLSATATFAWTEATAGTTFTCRLDSGTTSACTSPKTYTSLKVGSHTFQVKANRSGYISGTTTYTWTIASSGPAAPVIAPVATPTRSSSVSVSWNTTTGLTYTCSLDAATATACTSPKMYGGLIEGPHSVKVTARSSNGLTASSTVSWVVDQTPPPAPTVTSPASPSSSTTADVSWTGEDGATYTCSLDGGAASPCTSPKHLTGLTENPHALVVTPSDAAGNVGDAGTAVWVVDLTPPSAPSLVTGPASTTNATSATIQFADLDPSAVSFTCNQDSAGAAPCTSPFTTTGTLGNGGHSVDIIAKDQAGNSSDPLTVSWTVNTTAPAPVSGLSGPATPTNDTTPTFTWTSVGGSTYACKIDTGSEAACTSGDTFSVAATGSHTFSITVNDGVNTSAPTLWNWTVDTTAPTATVTTPATLVDGPLESFSEAVRGVSASTLTLKQGTTVVPTTIICLSQIGVSTDCTGAVSKARLKPNAPLVPGQTYTVAATSGVTDAAGNAVTGGSATFRAQRTQQETSPAITQLWRTVANASAYGSSYAQAGIKNASLSYTFTGTQVTWYTVSGPSGGIAKVLIDGSVIGNSNYYAPTLKLKVPHSRSGLTNAKHVLTFVALGAKGTPASTGTLITFDAVKVGAAAVVNNPSTSQLWAASGNAAASGKRFAVEDQVGAAAVMKFAGTKVIWTTMTGPSMGKAKVIIDGKLVATVDNYATSNHFLVYRSYPVAAGVHTIRIIVLGQHRTGATGNKVVLDTLTAV